MIHISKPWIGDEEVQSVLDVLKSGMLVQGSRTAELEKDFAQLCQVPYAIATSSGTSALIVSLLAHGVGAGDEVITSPFTFFASVGSILAVGATPVFVDIREDTYNIDETLIEEAITARTKAIIPVHLYGQPCDMDSICRIARDNGLIVVEDAAQAVGATHRGKPVGSFGTGCFSLYATKNVMSGEGGMTTTADAAIAERCRLIRNHGMSAPYKHTIFGLNYRMSDLHAAIGLIQLGRLENLTARRQDNASFLSENIHSAITPIVDPECTHVWHQYTMRVPEHRDEALKALQEAGIEARIYYPIPVHKQPVIAEMDCARVRMPVAERMACEVLSLPVHPKLTSSELEKIVSEVNRVC